MVESCLIKSEAITQLSLSSTSSEPFTRGTHKFAGSEAKVAMANLKISKDSPSWAAINYKLL